MDKLLIVEDSRSASQLMKHVVIEEYGFEVDIAQSMTEAKSLLNDGDHQYFAGLLDLNLPDAPDGEIVDLAIETNLPSIVFTGYINSELREKIWKKGIIDYVLKNGPHSLDYVAKLIGRINKNKETKVLVVDDSKTSLEYIRRLLDIHQFQVFTANNGEQGLEIFKSIEDIKLVITDSEMPGMNGIDLTTAIRKIANMEEVSIIGLSGMQKANLSADFLKFGANDFLFKPYGEEEFYCRINQNLEMLDSINKQKGLNEEKNRFLAMASHDVRSPISGITGLCELLLDSPDDCDTHEFIKVIYETATQVTTLVNDLLDVSVIESGKFEIIKTENDLADLVKQRVILSEVTATKKGTKLKFEYNEPVITHFDKERITQVIDNFLTNAIKYSPHESEVNIIVEKGSNKVSVIDHGPGIEESKLNSLFSMFNTVGSIPTGGEKSTGVGLAITKKIVDAHDGEISVESVFGEGSTFSFSLP